VQQPTRVVPSTPKLPTPSAQPTTTRSTRIKTTSHPRAHWGCWVEWGYLTWANAMPQPRSSSGKFWASNRASSSAPYAPYTCMSSGFLEAYQHFEMLHRWRPT